MSQTVAQKASSMLYGDDAALSRRQALISSLHTKLRNAVDTYMASTMIGLPLSLSTPNADQETVDEMLSALSSVLQLVIVGEHTLGDILKTSDFSSAPSNSFDFLQMSLLEVPQMDDNGIYWLRSLIKSKSLHRMVAAFLAFAIEMGGEKDPRLNAFEANLILSHSSDIIGTLTVIKTTPLRFDAKAPL